ncbi:hypothetical protein ACVIIV_006931 [Bradyrhizobium sp. USDA 4354]
MDIVAGVTSEQLTRPTFNEANGEIFGIKVRATAHALLPPPLAGEGWGEGVSASKNPQEEKALTRRCASTSPAGGRGETIKPA